MSREADIALRQLLQQHFLINHQQPHSSRVLSRIAFVIQALDDLDKIRGFIDTTDISAEKATQAFGRLIAGLLAIIFEAADGAGDPAVSRALIALLNFMQGKEYAGQERAWAAIGLAEGKIQQSMKERLQDLTRAQERTFSLFEQFADTTYLESWHQIEQQAFTANLESLRKIMQDIDDKETLSPEISEVWYDLATQRIDAMHALELELCTNLLKVCKQQQEKVERHLLEQKDMLAKITQEEAAVIAQDSLMLLNMKTPVVGWGAGASLSSDHVSDSTATQTPASTEDSAAARSVYDLLSEQAHHLEQTRRELEETRRALSERKLLEKAKAMLMKSLNISEDVAYRKIQQRAMDSNLRLGEVSEIIISTLNTTLNKPRK
ncbi:Nitrate regulatory protein [Thalassocella blandensis]|nr:Nitrate regulatory protein [Thalassocella blandensis]